MLKVTFLFTAGTAGWSESWYQDVATYDAADKRAQTFAVLRQNLCGSNVVLEGYRISDVDKPRSTQPYVLGELTNSNTMRSDLPRSAILGFAMAKPGYKRQIYLRGVPDKWIVILPQGGGKLGYSVDVWKPYNAWLAKLKSDRWRFQAIQRDLGVVGGVKITGIQAAGTRVMLTAPGLATAVGKEIRVHGIKGPKGSNTRALNRRHKVYAINGNEVTLSVKVSDIPGYTDFAYGFVIPAVKTWPVVEDTDLTRPMRKKVGKAFFSEPGRQRKRV